MVHQEFDVDTNGDCWEKIDKGEMYFYIFSEDCELKYSYCGDIFEHKFEAGILYFLSSHIQFTQKINQVANQYYKKNSTIFYYKILFFLNVVIFVCQSWSINQN